MRHLKAAILLNSLSPVSTATVLLFLIGTTPFERSTFEFLAQQLAIRNHRTITVKLMLIPEKPQLVKQKLHLVHEKTLKNLLPRKLYEPLEQIGDDIPWRDTYEVEEHLLPYYVAHNHSCYRALNSDLLDNLRREQIDTAIVYSGNPCQLALVHVLGIPFIYFDLDGFSDESRVASGTPLNFDVPSSACSDNLYADLFVRRFQNALCIMREYLTQCGPDFISAALSRRHRLLDSSIQRLFDDDTGISKQFKPFSSIHEIKQLAALFFINTDPILEYNIALPPHVIPVGGLHIDNPKPLFEPWNETIKSAAKGIIVVSLGNLANPAKMKLKQARSMLNALSRFTDYHIYWSVGPNLRLSNITEKELPSHISLMAYIPQNDLLAQKRTCLLITNGGIKSILEALTYGIPIVGIPLFGANKHNFNKVVHKGFGVMVEKHQLTEEALYNAIKKVLKNPKYKLNVKSVKKLWQRRKSRPLEDAIRWIEYVARNRRSGLTTPILSNWSIIRLSNVDVTGISILILIFPLLLTYFVFSALNLGKLQW